MRKGEREKGKKIPLRIDFFLLIFSHIDVKEHKNIKQVECYFVVGPFSPEFKNSKLVPSVVMAWKASASGATNKDVSLCS